MKAKDIQIGTICMTQVSGQRVKVKVTSIIAPDGRWNKRTKYGVQRCDNFKQLQARDSAALHEIQTTKYAVATHSIDTLAQVVPGLEVVLETEDAATAKVEYDKLKTEIKNGTRSGFVRMLVGGKSVWRFPPAAAPVAPFIE
jgi:hypothetical protein